MKSGNILLDEYNHCKLADFGFAIVKEDSATVLYENNFLSNYSLTVNQKSGLTSTGTLSWMAPELFGLRPKFSTKSDMYLLLPFVVYDVIL